MTRTRNWSSETDDALRKLHAEGASPAQIMAKLGYSRSAVYLHERVLGLAPRKAGRPPKIPNLICAHCGKPFRRLIGQGSSHRYCSKACSSAGHYTSTPFEDRVAVIRLLAEGVSKAVIARAYGIDPGQLTRVARGEGWQAARDAA